MEAMIILNVTFQINEYASQYENVKMNTLHHAVCD